MKLASTWRMSAVDDSHDSTACAGAPKLGSARIDNDDLLDY